MSPAGLLLLALVSVAAGGGEHGRLQRAHEAWDQGVADLRTSSTLTDAQRNALESMRRTYATEGFDLRVFLMDSGPRFSLGDFTSELHGYEGCGADCVLITATPATLHSESRWFRYKQVRTLARSLAPQYRRAQLSTLLHFGAELLKEGRRRARHRRLMVGVAVVAVAGLGLLLGRALGRRRGEEATVDEHAVPG